MPKIIIERSKCTHFTSGCAKCIEECPMQLIDEEWFLQKDHHVYEDDQCIECRNCEVTCIEKAIKVLNADLS